MVSGVTKYLGFGMEMRGGAETETFLGDFRNRAIVRGGPLAGFDCRSGCFLSVSSEGLKKARITRF